MTDWIRALAVSFARRLVQEAEMQEQTFAQGECPNCGHDWTAHGDYIARGEKVCWTFDPAIMDERHPYYVADVIASECDVADELAVIVIQMEDEIIHTDDLPWCDDPDCPCHYDFTVAGEAEYHAIIEQPLADGLLTEPEAARIYDGKQL